MKTILKEKNLIESELAELKSKFPNWNFSFDFLGSIPNAVSVIKDLVKEAKTKFPDIKFSICRENYSCLLILKVKFNKEIAYYGGDNIGYIIYERELYNEVYNFFNENEYLDLINVRVINYVENKKEMLIEFKQLR
jgi:hypothetical protein